MEIGIAVGDLRGPATAAEIVDQVRAAADAGFGTAWTSQAMGWDALVALVVAGRVPGIGLGTAVVPVPQRHPLVLAAQALSVQAATGNRLTLGIGAGIGAMVTSMFGLPHDRPATRMREYLTVLGPLLRGEAVDHRGATLTATGAVGVPGATAPPVLVAALGPAMLRVAGELAEGTITWLTGPRTLHQHVVPHLVRAAEGAGRPAPGVARRCRSASPPTRTACATASATRSRWPVRCPEYRAVLDREGARGPQDVAVVGDEDAVGGGTSAGCATPAPPSSWPRRSGRPTSSSTPCGCSPARTPHWPGPGEIGRPHAFQRVTVRRPHVDAGGRVMTEQIARRALPRPLRPFRHRAYRLLIHLDGGVAAGQRRVAGGRRLPGHRARRRPGRAVGRWPRRSASGLLASVLFGGRGRRPATQARADHRRRGRQDGRRRRAPRRCSV